MSIKYKGLARAPWQGITRGREHALAFDSALIRFAVRSR